MGLVMAKSIRSVPPQRTTLPLAVALVAWLLVGCTPRPRMLPSDQQIPIDRSLIVTPQGFGIRPFVRNLSAPVAITWDDQGSMLIAQGANHDDEPSIIGFKKDGSFFQVYPYGQRMFVDIGKPRFSLYGPIGGMVFFNGRVYVSHRDANGKGVITALDYHGGHTTIVSGLPAAGDYSITDLAIDKQSNPAVPRLYFGVGAATNSGVVGIDNWNWVRSRPDVHDHPAVKLRLMGFRFDSPNPFSGLFGPADIAVTAPFQPFNVSNQTEVLPGKFASASIYSCPANGGELRLEAHGVRYPRGLGFNGFFCFFTNQGMELRGTRPIKDDPDSLLSTSGNSEWFGWPDYTTDLQSIDQDRYQPPLDMIAHTGYPFHVLPVINRNDSNLPNPTGHRDSVQAIFSPLSGVGKFDFVPAKNPVNRTQFRQVLVALSGDSAPLSTSGRPVRGPLGYKVVRVTLDQKNLDDPSRGSQNVTDFVANTAGGPGSLIDPKNSNLLERPIDVKFGPDGLVYILDAGRMHITDGRQVYEDGTGKIFILRPQSEPIMYHTP